MNRLLSSEQKFSLLYQIRKILLFPVKAPPYQESTDAPDIFEEDELLEDNEYIEPDPPIRPVQPVRPVEPVQPVRPPTGKKLVFAQCKLDIYVKTSATYLS